MAKIKGVKILNKTFFNEFTIEIEGDSKALVEKLSKQNIIAGLPVDGNKIIMAAYLLHEKGEHVVFVSKDFAARMGDARMWSIRNPRLRRKAAAR